MIEKMAQRLSRIIDSYKIPIQLKVSIKKTIQSEVSNLCTETADTIRMIDIYTLIDKFDFTTDDIEKFSRETQENYNDVYERYGLDGIQKMKHVLEEKGIFWRKENEKNT